MTHAQFYELRNLCGALPAIGLHPSQHNGYQTVTVKGHHIFMLFRRNAILGQDWGENGLKVIPVSALHPEHIRLGVDRFVDPAVFFYKIQPGEQPLAGYEKQAFFSAREHPSLAPTDSGGMPGQ